MKKKYYILIGILVVILTGVGIGLSMYFKPHKDFGKSKPDFILTAKDLFKEFDANETAANQKFVAEDKTVQLNGTVSELNKNQDGTNSIVLTDPDMQGSINCSLMPSENDKAAKLRKGDRMTIKGQCTGMQELIEKQVIMIRCVVVD